MKIGKYNIGAIIFTVFLQQILGALWYSPYLFGNKWLTLIGKDIETLKASGATPYIVSIVAYLIICIVFIFILHSTNTKKAVPGAKLGFLLWLGFIFPCMAINYTFQGQPVDLLLIDSGHFLFGTLIAGGVLGELST